MDKELYLGKAPLKESPKKSFNWKLRDGSITADKLDPELQASIGCMSPINNDEIDDLF